MHEGNGWHRRTMKKGGLNIRVRYKPRNKVVLLPGVRERVRRLRGLRGWARGGARRSEGRKNLRRARGTRSTLCITSLRRRRRKLVDGRQN